MSLDTSHKIKISHEDEASQKSKYSDIDYLKQYYSKSSTGKQTNNNDANLIIGSKSNLIKFKFMYFDTKGNTLSKTLKSKSILALSVTTYLALLRNLGINVLNFSLYLVNAKCIKSNDYSKEKKELNIDDIIGNLSLEEKVILVHKKKEDQKKDQIYGVLIREA